MPPRRSYGAVTSRMLKSLDRRDLVKRAALAAWLRDEKGVESSR